MRAALHAEFTKLRTVRAPAWLLLGTIALTVASAIALTAVISSRDVTRLALTGVILGQAPVVVLGVQSISSEYGSGMIHTTLVAMPRRHTVLAAKVLILAVTVATAAIVAVLGSLLAARHPVPADGSTLRAAVGTVLYLVLIALLSLGAAAIIRDTAAGTGTVLGLLYLFPLLAHTVGDPRWQRLLDQIGPMSAGLAVQAATGPGPLPIGPWAGLGVLAAWSSTALLAGGALVRLRDA